ncbi:MAG: metallophosphoesterase family protein [Pyrinomonadaceae bacterium]
MKQTIAAIFIVIVGLISGCSTQPSQQQTPQMQPEFLAAKTATPPDYQWVQLGEQGAVIVRAIFKQSGQSCPSIDTVDNNGKPAPVAMALRAAAMPDNFAITVCEATLASADKLKSATLGGKNLTLPVKSPKRIVVVGDTGCRVASWTQQNCLDNKNVPESEGEEWLFTTTVASALNLKPDLIIHVGDYIYREAECTDPAKCGDKSVFGDKWATWEVDFFSPAKPLLETVPWVFARGNHESCDREWRGWYLFMDPHSAAKISWTGCSKDETRSAPFHVPLDGLDLLVMDTAPEKSDLSDYQAALQKHTGSSPAWFVTHRPLWGVGATFASRADSQLIRAMQAANVKFLVGGHLHSFEMIQFKDNDSPPQMIAGGGATELDDKFGQDYFDQTVNSFKKGDPDNSEYLHKFTFALVEPQSEGWHVTVIDEDGTTEAKKFVVKNN